MRTLAPVPPSSQRRRNPPGPARPPPPPQPAAGGRPSSSWARPAAARTRRSGQDPECRSLAARSATAPSLRGCQAISAWRFALIHACVPDASRRGAHGEERQREVHEIARGSQTQKSIAPNGTPPGAGSGPGTSYSPGPGPGLPLGLSCGLPPIVKAGADGKRTQSVGS